MPEKIDSIRTGRPRQIADVRSLVDTIRTADPRSLRALTKDLVHLDVPGMLPIMEGLLNDENSDLALAAYDWFERTLDERASTILISKLEDTHRDENDRWLAAKALGQRGNAAAIVSLRRVAEEFVKATPDPLELRARLVKAKLTDSVARLLVRLSVSEGMLGGDELAAIPVVFALAEANSGRQPIVRVEGVNALESVVAQGMFDVLRGALRSEDSEIVEGSIRALQLVGAREAVDLLVATATPERMELAEIALTAVVAVTGPGPGMDKSVFDLPSDALRSWWQVERPKFRSGVCYRWGKLMSVATLVELLRDPKQRPYVVDELRVVTGFDCGFDVDVPSEQQDSVVSTAERWAATVGANYKTGSLYKYGHERNLKVAIMTGVFADS